MATLVRIQGRVHAAVQLVSPNHILCWIAGAVLSLEVLSHSFGVA